MFILFHAIHTTYCCYSRNEHITAYKMEDWKRNEMNELKKVERRIKQKENLCEEQKKIMDNSTQLVGLSFGSFFSSRIDFFSWFAFYPCLHFYCLIFFYSFLLSLARHLQCVFSYAGAAAAPNSCEKSRQSKTTYIFIEQHKKMAFEMDSIWP